MSHQEEREAPVRPVWRVVRLGRSGRGRVAAAAAVGVVAAAAAVTLAGVSAWLVARAAERPPVLHLTVAIVAVRATGIGRGVFRYVERLLGHDGAFRVLGDLRVRVVERLAHGEPASLQRATDEGPERGAVGRGDLLARFVGDVDGLIDVWVRVLIPTVVTLAVVSGGTGMLLALLPSTGLVVAGSILIAAVGAPLVAAHLQRRRAARVSPARGAYNDRLVRVLDGSAELTVLGVIDHELHRVDEAEQAVRDAETRSATAAGNAAALTVAAGGTGVVGALWVGADAVVKGTIGGPTLAVIVLLPFALHELVSQWTAAIAQVPQLRVAAGRLLEVVSAERADMPTATTGDGADVDSPFAHGRALGVRLEGLSVGWPGGTPLLTGLDVTVAAGEHVAFVGPSGLGKSTLAATVQGSVDPVAGRVLVVGPGGEERVVHRLNLRAREHLVAWGQQDAHVFDSTLAANLRIARPDATDDDLRRALRLGHLDGWPAGAAEPLAAMVGEHGTSMSGGERQRLTLARVALTTAPIVVLDEPTEHLDDTMGAQVLANLLDELRGVTVLVITHRPELLPPDVPVVDLVPHHAGSGGG